MENSPSSEANRPSASHEIPHGLLNPKAHFCMVVSCSFFVLIMKVFCSHKLAK